MIKLILFDLGGVVIEITNLPHYRYLARLTNISSREVAIRIRMENAAHERGDISLERFNKNVSDDLGIRPDQVLWMYYFKKLAKLNKGVAKIIRALRKDYKVGFMSNVDKERYDYTVKYVIKPVMGLFDYKFASYKLREVKPSPIIYQKVLKLTKLKADEILFVDNDPRNVEGALDVGIKAVLFTSVVKLERDLEKFGIGV